jgi:hypothetical protein
MWRAYAFGVVSTVAAASERLHECHRRGPHGLRRGDDNTHGADPDQLMIIALTRQ